MQRPTQPYAKPQTQLEYLRLRRTRNRTTALAVLGILAFNVILWAIVISFAVFMAKLLIDGAILALTQAGVI